MRLNQYIASSGICSRREADRLIEAGEVTINKKPAKIGQQVFLSDIVHVSGELVTPQAEMVYILVNKPLGITSTTDKNDKTNIIDFVNHHVRLFHVGRLDKDSTGAILLTNDGDIVNKLLRSENDHEKTYIVDVNKKLTKEFIKSISEGVKILNDVTNSYVVTKPAQVKQLTDTRFEIVLTQGYNRQIRRMCSALGYRVVALNRTKFLFLTLEKLKQGSFRNLTKEEVAQLKSMADN